MLLDPNSRAGLNVLREAVKATPKSAVEWRDRGLIQIRLGRYREAIESFDRGLQLDPEYTDILPERGHAQLGLKQLDLAEADFLSCLEHNPGNASYKTYKHSSYKA